MDPIKPLQKNDFMIMKLIITDEAGIPIDKPFKLKNGPNIFRCKALYADGAEEFFSPYWTCPITYKRNRFEGDQFRRSVEVDVWSIFGQRKRESVTVNAAPKHEKYTELSCWVFPPKNETPTGNAEIPRDSTGFNYDQIV